MTDKVHTSFGRTFRSREASIVNRYTGLGAGQGWVVKSSRRLVADSEGDLSSGALNAFDESHSGGSFDVTIDTGEALVRGAYLARDTTTTVTLDSSTTNQTVYVGWQDGATDTVIIGKAGAFTSGDPKLAIWEFDTDGSGVTSATDKRPLGEPATGGVTYLQSSTPSNAESGGNWLDTDTGIYRVYADLGSGSGWHPIPPVTVTEEASTFAESDVTVTHTDTEVSTESIQLVSGPTGNVTSRDADDGSDSISNRQGLKINPNTDLTGVKVTASSNTSGASTAYLQETDGTVLDSTSLSSGTAELSGDLSSGTAYYVGLDNGGSSWTRGIDSSPSYPYTGTDLDITSGVFNLGGSPSENSNAAYAIVDVEGGYTPTSGDALVEWDSAVPTDINSWDLATFQRTLDNETVTIDVEDGQGNVLFSDIGQNFDISTIDTSKNVTLRANLSRSDTSNNPTLDYAARRFTR